MNISLFDVADSVMTSEQKIRAIDAMCQDIEQQQIKYSSELASLREKGKEKTARFRELMGNKLTNSLIISRLQVYGLWNNDTSPEL